MAEQARVEEQLLRDHARRQAAATGGVTSDNEFNMIDSILDTSVELVKCFSTMIHIVFGRNDTGLLPNSVAVMF